MGSCVSVQKNPDSNLKFRFFFGSKHDELAMPSPVKVDRPIADGALKSPWPPTGSVAAARGFGSKEETFFDSQPWLESDCDDDFVSVNGDFTPSRGSTPVHHNFSAATKQGSTALPDTKTPVTIPEPPPPEKKKRLSDLFQESLRSDRYVPDNNQNTPGNENGKDGTQTTVVGLPPKSVEGTPFSSVAYSACSSEPTPLGDYRAVREKNIKSAQCCLPRMLSSRSFNERKRMASPAS